MARVRRPINTPSGPSSEVKTVAVIGVIVLLGVAYWWANRDTSEKEGEQAGSGSDAPAAVAAYPLPQPAHGGDEAGAVLVKFTDFQ